MKRLAAAFALLTAPAMAQDKPVETVVVNGQTLIGLWRIDTPRTPKPPERKVTWHPARDSYCRIEAKGEDLVVACLDKRTGSGSVDFEGSNIHFAWGSMLAREVLDATLVSATRLEGGWAIKLSGVAIGSDDVSVGTKLIAAGDDEDKAGKAGLLTRTLGQLQDGVLSDPHTASSRTFQPPDQDALRKLGAIQTAAYLGEMDDVVPAGAPPFTFSVYDVAFANGQRFCGLHQRADGVIDGFRCV